MSTNTDRIAENYRSICERIDDAARRSGRQGCDIKLVAVTKYVGLEETQALLEVGCFDLGESRPQELWNKAEGIHDERVRWHMIGHLQRNKVKRTLRYTSLIHSGDSERLLKEIDGEAVRMQRPIPVFLEVNVSGDEAKHGFRPDQLSALVPQLDAYSYLQVRGLMAMASREGGADAARQDFAALRNLRDQLRPECPDGVTLDELSMGMSGDFETAIEEGATVVRVGSALYA